MRWEGRSKYTANQLIRWDGSSFKQLANQAKEQMWSKEHQNVQTETFKVKLKRDITSLLLKFECNFFNWHIFTYWRISYHSPQDVNSTVSFAQSTAWQSMWKEAEKCWLSAVSGICIIAAQNILYTLLRWWNCQAHCCVCWTYRQPTKILMVNNCCGLHHRTIIFIVPN